jgi:hypothetical protein
MTRALSASPTNTPWRTFPTREPGTAAIFRRKWPGLITAFDRVLAAPTRAELDARMRRFFALAHAGSSSARDREAVSLARELGLNAKAQRRLELLLDQARERGLEFAEACIVPSFGGSIPADLAWVPPHAHARWIYYEPGFDIPRNLNPGKRRGWGSMQQLRDPRTHAAFPKLIFTTSSNPRYGFRAFVVDAGWYAKLGGASSQQYHYLSVHDPTKPGEGGEPASNLADAGLELRDRLGARRPEDLLHLIAGVYNSAYAARLGSCEGASTLPLPRLSAASPTDLRELAALARRARSLHARIQARSEEPFPCSGQPSDSPRLIEEAGEVQRAIDTLVDLLV